MSEYWVSRKKYFCKYCEIYIADDAPSRQQHETGLRHKGNKERFVRGLYKAGEKKKKDLEEEKREMERIGKAAQAAFTQDLGAGHATASTSSSAPSTSSAPRKPPPKPSNPYTNYTTAEFLGYTDPEIERLQAEAERRRMQGVAGEWEVVATSSSTQATPVDEPTELTMEGEGSRKREAPPPEDDERNFKLRRKVLSTGLGELYEPDSIPIKLKAKKEEPDLGIDPLTVSNGDGKPGIAPVTSGSRSTEVPKWTKIQWKRVDSEEAGAQVSADTSAHVTKHGEEHHDTVKSEETETTVKEETRDGVAVKAGQELPSSLEEPPVPSGLFRKRKAPGSGGRGRR